MLFEKRQLPYGIKMNVRRLQNLAKQHERLLGALAERLDGPGITEVSEHDWAHATQLLMQSHSRADSQNVWLLVQADGRMIDCSANAAALFGLNNLGDYVHDVADRLSRSRNQTEILAVSTITGNLVILQATAMPDGAAWQLEETQSTLSPDYHAAIVAIWGLTPVEAEIAQALFKGQSAEQIAAHSARTIGTVRQIIKALLGKMQVRSQAQAVAQLASVALAGTPRHTVSQDLPRRLQVSTPGDRVGTITYWRYGDPSGRPTLFFHGALFGITGHPDVCRDARLFGFDVIAPERPGYGVTHLPANSDPVELTIARAKAILDSLAIDRVLVWAHDVGSVYAFAFARRYPDRVSGILCAPATPPMMGWSQTSDMPPLHRVSAFAAQKAPAMMEMLVKIGLHRISREGLSAIPRLIFADSEHDREVLLRPEAYPVLEQLYNAASTQDAVGFVQDMFVTNRNWSDWLPGVACPVHLLHGQKSRTVSEKALRSMCARLPDAALTVIPDAGHTLPISHSEQIMRHAFQM